jgi:parvulin-like peptidyl-prolyl isomerase
MKRTVAGFGVVLALSWTAALRGQDVPPTSPPVASPPAAPVPAAPASAEPVTPTPPPAAAASSTGQSTIIQRVLIKVNGEVFTQKDLEEKQIDALQQQNKGELQGDALTTALTELMPDLLVNAVDEMLILQRGKELGYHLSDEEFKSTVDRIKSDNKMNDADFKTALTQEGLTLDGLRARLDRSYIVKTVQGKEILGHMTLTEEESRQYYDKHPDEFMKPPSVMLRELLVAVPVADTKPGQPTMFSAGLDQAARQKITSLRERALKGEAFETLVAEASDSPSKSTGGLIGPIGLSEMSTGIRDALDKMQPGDITQPFRTPRGYQLYKLESRAAAERQPFDSVRDDIAQKIGEARLDVETSKYLQTLRTQAFVEWKRPDLQQLYEKRLAERQALNR